MMADSNVKFVRVRGKVVPIRADQVGKQKKRVQKSASDTVSRKDAVKSLRHSSKRAVKFSKNLTAFGAGLAGLSALGLTYAFRKTPTIGKKMVGYSSAVGAVLAGQSLTTGLKVNNYGKQLKKDASRINKAKALASSRQPMGAGAQSARRYSSLFENGLKENQGLNPSAATINPMPPIQPTEIPPPVPQLPGTTSV